MAYFDDGQWGEGLGALQGPTARGSTLDTASYNAALGSGSGINWNAALKTLGQGTAAGEDKNSGALNPIAIPPLQVQQPNIPQSQAVGSHLGFSMRDVIELLYKRQQAYQAAGMNPKGGVVPPDFSAPMGLLGIR